MKKILLLLVFSGLFRASAQEEKLHCFTTEMFKKNIQNNLQYEKNRSDLEDFTRQFIRNAQVQRVGSQQIYIIPVVFHILHQYGSENITDGQVIDAVRVMTEDFRKQNADTNDIIPVFKSIAADCEIEFRLANLDPNGNCTNGIDRIVTPLTYLADDGSKLNQWPQDRYLNIWTANSLQMSGAAAYAYYPGGWNSNDGIMCLSHYVGSIGSSSVNRSHVLSHEVGHYLNLEHVWGSNNSPGVACGDDGVFDTPVTMGWNHCDLAGSRCNPPIIENVQNFMEYSYCDNMFTQGQKVRMHAALNSNLSDRDNLWKTANLIATGTDGSPVTICKPIADFMVDYKYVCTGSPITFYDLSWNAKVTTWSWSFPGGVPSTSPDSAPVVTYPAAGIYDATLTVTSAGGTDSITRTATVRVTDLPTRTMPFTESFEDANSFPGTDGFIENPDNSISAAWMRVSNANTTPGGTNSIKINNFNNTRGEIDSWITPSIDFSNVGFPVYLSFQVSNAQRNSTSTDELKIFYSLNCGQSWMNTGYAKSGTYLATAGIVTSNFTPNNPSQWRLENVNVNPVNHKPNVRFKFQNTSDRGNNVFVDDINITGVITSIDETDDLQSGFALYPNPTSGESTVSFGLKKSSHVTIDVKNILGQTILSLIDKTMMAGIHDYKLPVLAPGIYLVDVTVNNKHHIRKLVVS